MLAQYDDELTYYLSVSRGETAGVATIIQISGGQRAIEVNGRVTTHAAFGRLFQALSRMEMIPIPRGEMQDFRSRRDGVPACPWATYDALEVQVSDEIAAAR